MNDKIKNLELDEDLKSKLLKLLINNSSSESDTESEPEISFGDEINELDYSSSFDDENEEIYNNCVCSTFDNPLKAFSKVNNLSINILTDNQKDILNMIEQLFDEKLKKKVIEYFIKGETSNETRKSKLDDKGLINHQ